ncbi:MAG: flotillin family protein [Verrucomicrobia bacterium]|nr:flotillin family protein [Verrucomicrobiota bacterium]
MNSTYTIIFAVGTMILVIFVFTMVWASRYVKVGPNQALIVSGRQRQLADGTRLGFRIVKGGGTFVLPVIETVEVLSLEVITVEMPGSKAQTAGGRAVETDCVAQVKIGGDDVSIVAAAEHFLGKSQAEIGNVLRSVLEKHLSSVLRSSSMDDTTQNPAVCAVRVQSAASADLARMGMSILSFTIRNARAV